jgi:hypothetical protein
VLALGSLPAGPNLKPEGSPRHSYLPGTDLPQWDKNWYCSSESLWYDRWQQVMEVMPDFVQIITCTSSRGLDLRTQDHPDLNADIRKGMTMVSRAIFATPHQRK